MKKILLVLVSLLLPVSTAHALLDRSTLPESSHYSGTHDRSFDLGAGNILDIHLEFAVYSHEDEVELEGGIIKSEAQIMQEWTGHTGDADFVYAYQVYCEQSSTAPLTYFSLTGINPDTISDIQNDIGEAESLDSGANQSGGVEPSDSGFNASVTKAIWKFEGGSIINQGENSWFLFLYSDSDWIAGDIEVQHSNDDIPVPEVPEPATMLLMVCGTVLSLKRKIMA